MIYFFDNTDLPLTKQVVAVYLMSAEKWVSQLPTQTKCDAIAKKEFSEYDVANFDEKV